MATVVKDAERRRAIIDAALACFLKFGYGKTSLDDIARQAGLSRPLLYKKFPNKEAIFAAVYEDTLEALTPQVQALLASRRSRKAKLLQLCEVMCVGLFAMIREAPMAEEFYVAVKQVLPEVSAKHDRRWAEALRAVIGDKDSAEVFDLALDGLLVDKPTIPTLRKRVALLVDRFAP